MGVHKWKGSALNPSNPDFPRKNIRSQLQSKVIHCSDGAFQPKDSKTKIQVPRTSIRGIRGFPLVDTLLLDLCFAQTYGDGLDSPGYSLPSSGIEDAAISFVEKRLGKIEHMGITYTSGYRIGNMTYAYVQQILERVRHLPARFHTWR